MTVQFQLNGSEALRDNFMTLIAAKCHLFASGYNIKGQKYLQKLAMHYWEEYVAKLLGVLIDSDLSFNNRLIVNNRITGLSLNPNLAISH